MKKTRVIAFEGPDGVGKSTLVAEAQRQLTAEGLALRLFSFPGKEPGSLGELVYALHHDPKSRGVRGISPTALQALHIAAHIDFLENLRNAPDPIILLDRFWWSTYVYGKVLGAEMGAIEHLIEAEKGLWRAHEAAVILINRPEENPTSERLELEKEYGRLEARERRKYPTFLFTNAAGIHESSAALAELVRKIAIPKGRTRR